MTRQTTVADKAVRPTQKAREKADPNDPLQVGAPMPSMITSIAVDVGSRVAKGDKLLTLEAMKIHMTVSAPEDGVVAEVCARVGDTVGSKDLLLRLRA